jgi:hypothetical protein
MQAIKRASVGVGGNFDTAIGAGETRGKDELSSGKAARLGGAEKNLLCGLLSASVVERQIEGEGVLALIGEDQVVAGGVIWEPPNTLGCRLESLVIRPLRRCGRRWRGPYCGSS